MGFPPHVGRVREERVLPRVLPPGDALAVQEDETSEGRREEGGRSRHGAGPRRHKLAVPGSRQAPLEGGAGVAEDHRARAEGEDAGPMGYGIAARRSFFPRQEGGGGGGRGRPAVLQHPADVLEPQFQLRGSQAGRGGAGSPAGHRSGPPRGAAPPPGSRRPREGERPAAGCRRLRRRRAGGGECIRRADRPRAFVVVVVVVVVRPLRRRLHGRDDLPLHPDTQHARVGVPRRPARAGGDRGGERRRPPRGREPGSRPRPAPGGGGPRTGGNGGGVPPRSLRPPPPPQPPPPPNPVPASGGSPLLRRPFRLRQRRQ